MSGPRSRLGGQSEKDVTVLWHVADSQANDAVRRPTDNLALEYLDSAAAGHEAEDRSKGRRLAAAVSSEEGRHSSQRNAETDSLEYVGAGDGDVQVRNLDGVGHNGSPDRKLGVEVNRS